MPACRNNELDFQFYTNFKDLTVSQIVHLSVIMLSDTMGYKIVPIWPLPKRDGNITIDLVESQDFFVQHDEVLKSLISRQNNARQQLFITLERDCNEEVLTNLNQLFKELSEINDKLEECISELSKTSKDGKSKKLLNLVSHMKSLRTGNSTLRDKCFCHFQNSQS